MTWVGTHSANVSIGPVPATHGSRSIRIVTIAFDWCPISHGGGTPSGNRSESQSWIQCFRGDSWFHIHSRETRVPLSTSGALQVFTKSTLGGAITNYMVYSCGVS